MIRSIIFLLLVAVLVTETVAAQPDRTAALEKAKAKFEKDIEKAETTLLTGIDKAILQATKAGNKALVEKLNYERPLFVTSHLVPTAFPSENYLLQRSKATTAILAVYQPAITELTKAKKLAESAAIEDSLSEILKAGRGYGLAFPDLETHPGIQFHIENKDSGLVMDTELDVGHGKLVLTPKVGKSKPTQCWRLERDQKGFLIRNVKSEIYVSVPGDPGEAGWNMIISSFDQKNEIPAPFLFRLTDNRREISIEPVMNAFVLTPTEKKVKGVTTTYVTEEKKENPPSATQLWRLVEAK